MAFPFKHFALCKALGLTLLLSSANALCAQYYVSGTGSDTYAVNSVGTPWRTLAKAATKVLPGDTVWIMNGTYTTLTASVSGTAAAPITWKAYAGHAPEIRVDPTQWSAVNVTGAYQIFDGLIVTGNNDNVTLAQAEADYNKSVPTFFKLNPATGVADINPATGKAVTVDTANPTYVAGYTVDPKFNSSGFNIDNRGRRIRAHHITVRNSTVRKFGCGGVAGLQVDYLVIENNKIYGNAWYSRYGCSGATIFTANMTLGDTNPAYRNIVRGNQFWDNKGLVKWLAAGKYSDGNGFILDISDTDYVGRTLIANNLTVFNGGSGIHSYKGRHVDILNNTAYMNGVVMKTYPDIYANTTEDAKLMNNIVYSRAGQPSNSNSGNTNVAYNYNIYFNGTVAGTTTSVMGANDLKADPLFSSTTYDAVNGPAAGAFRLTSSSPGLNSGVNLQTAPTFVPSTDMVGTARPQGSGVDRGAFERPVP